MSLWRWLLAGTSEQVMPKDWLANRERLAGYEAWTERQGISRVEKDTAYFEREAFWQRIEQAREARTLSLVRPSGVRHWKAR